jgi:phosphoribosylglycinamide formyltransferase-1
MKKNRLAIFASGSGSNAESIMKYFQNHSNIEVAAVASNIADAFVLERAKKFNIPSKVFSNAQFRECDDILKWLAENKITHIVLGGFLLLIPEKLINAFPNRIINIHPSLLPKFGGKGMYGSKVHEAVVAAGENETGLTIHLVNAHYDEGKILSQIKCQISPQDDAKAVAAKVLQLEHEHYPRAIEQWVGK